MYPDFGDVELGLVVNIRTLREALKALSVGEKRWWIASSPQDAVTTGSLIVGHGSPQCEDRLNNMYFRFPVLGEVTPSTRPDKLLLLIDPSTCTPEEPGLYMGTGRVVQDFLEDFISFYPPIKDALIDRLKADGTSKSEER